MLDSVTSLEDQMFLAASTFIHSLAQYLAEACHSPIQREWTTISEGNKPTDFWFELQPNTYHFHVDWVKKRIFFQREGTNQTSRGSISFTDSIEEITRRILPATLP